MFSFDRFEKCYKASLKVVNLYDVLTDVAVDDESSMNEFKMFVEELKKAVLEEDKLYSKLSLEDIREYIDKIKDITSDEGILFSDIRINNKLVIFNDRLLGNSIKNGDMFPTLDKDEELSLTDIIDSKIAIDTYKLINKKLSYLSFTDKKSLEYAKKIDSLNIEHIIYKISLNVLAEKLAINSLFNISKLPNIDLSMVEDRFFEEKGIIINLYDSINSRIYENVIDMINRFSKLSLDTEDCINIYDNLFYITQFEVMFEYLTKEQLEDISLRFDEITASNEIVIGNVKRLVRNKISEF